MKRLDFSTINNRYFRFTGQLGGVMKESATLAMSWIRLYMYISLKKLLESWIRITDVKVSSE